MICRVGELFPLIHIRIFGTVGTVIRSNKKNIIFKFGALENVAFETLKNYFASKPVLAVYSACGDGVALRREL